MSCNELDKLTLVEVEAAGYTTAVLPLGACEPHGYHLPYGTDNYLAGAVAIGATEHCASLGGKAVCLPPIRYGYEGNMRGFPLAMNLRPSTLTLIVRDIAWSLAESGLDYLVLVNGHGGNELKSMIRELNDKVELFICGVNWWESVADVAGNVTPGSGDHANEMETAGVLHLQPELVHMDRADDGHMNVPVIEEFSQGWVKYSRAWKAFAPSSGAGDARPATAQAGEQLINSAIERIGVFLHKVSTTKRHPGFPFAH